MEPPSKLAIDGDLAVEPPVARPYQSKWARGLTSLAPVIAWPGLAS